MYKGGAGLEQARGAKLLSKCVKRETSREQRCKRALEFRERERMLRFERGFAGLGGVAREMDQPRNFPRQRQHLVTICFEFINLDFGCFQGELMHINASI
jgi:hypothetical protein